MPIGQEFGTSYNPLDVALGKPKSSKGSLYLSPTGTPAGADAGTSPQSGSSPTQPATGTLGPSAIRATGAGPFDAAYRQNLATYAGGQFMPPSGGNLLFNPTDISTFPGAPVGGGNAPRTGTPFSLLAMAQGGLPFNWGSPIGAMNNPLSTFMGGGGVPKGSPI